MISSISQYIFAVEHLDMMTRTLGSRHICPVCDDDGALRCRVGNAAIVFEVMCEGRRMAMRVYMRPHHNLRAIYGENYYPDELLINSTDENFGMADVVLCDWYEGVTLQSKIEALCGAPEKMSALSAMFEEFALWLLNERWAHGDLKPENIIFSKDGLHLIDFDAVYRKGFSIDDCVEIGTRQFQHPTRGKLDFNKDIDDYPIALITTALAALSLNASIGRSLAESDYLLIKPQLAVVGKDEMLARIERLFAERGDVRHYRIARLLRSTRYSLPQLKNLLEARSCAGTQTESERLSLEYYNGYWGFAEEGRFVIPPLYDLAFEFSEGLALVKVGDVWHFIDAQGRVVITCGRGSGIKPFRNGATRIVREDGEFAIFSDGRIEKL